MKSRLAVSVAVVVGTFVAGCSAEAGPETSSSSDNFTSDTSESLQVPRFNLSDDVPKHHGRIRIAIENGEATEFQFSTSLSRVNSPHISARVDSLGGVVAIQLKTEKMIPKVGTYSFADGDVTLSVAHSHETPKGRKPWYTGYSRSDCKVVIDRVEKSPTDESYYRAYGRIESAADHQVQAFTAAFVGDFPVGVGNSIDSNGAPESRVRTYDEAVAGDL